MGGHPVASRPVLGEVTPLQAFLLTLALGGVVVGLLVRWVRKTLEVETIPTRELRPELREQLKNIPGLWCSQCFLTELVCDVHPRIPYEKCGCPDGVPRACPRCTDYDVTALLEEIAVLRRSRTGSES